MRKSLVALMLGFSSFSALASDTMDDILALCKVEEEMGMRIMTMRQAGAEMSRLMEALTDPLARAMVVMAYRTPRYQAESVAKLEAQDFAADAYLNCFERETK